MESEACHASNPGSAIVTPKFSARALSDALRKEEDQAKSRGRVTLIAHGAVNTEIGTIIVPRL